MFQPYFRMIRYGRIFFTLLLSICSALSYSQTVQWADEVVEFSSELTPLQYSAQQILGKPNVLPSAGESPNAWTPDRANRKEYIKVGFSNPIPIRQIAIAESYNPSALTKVTVYDERGNEFEVTDFQGRSIPIEGRMINLFYETSYKVAAVRLDFDGALVPDYYSVDAVAISDSDIQIVAEVDVPEYLENGVLVERLSENINSEYREYKPVLSPDGKTMWFSRKFHPGNIGGVEDQEDIWVSELDENGEWTLARNAGSVLNNEGPNFVSAVTPDGKTAILGNRYLDNGQMEAGVSISTMIGNEWSKPVALEIENDYNLHEKANYYLANSRTALLMSIQREDAYGDRDIYVSFLEDDSTWTEPLNLGPVINTASEESAPFIAADDQTMYFSSNGFSGYGGADIYVSKRLDDTWTNWSEPQNMGPDINSEYEDLFFNIPTESNIAYYSRGVTDDNTDIFKIELPLFQRPETTIIVKGNLSNKSTKDPILARITYERLSDGTRLGIINSDPITGEYELVLPIGEIYAIHAEAEGFISESIRIDLTEVAGEVFEIEHQDIALVPVEVEEVVTLNNIFFAFDRATLKTESYPELNRVVDYMEKYATMEIEIVGHTDNTGPEIYNEWLSKWRAEAVVNYLKSKDVDSERLSYSYFGETKPVASNETVEGRSQNRRVEFVIKKK